MSKYHLLVVDDDDIDRKISEKQLSDIATVTGARTGKECLEALEEQQFDCILLDHLLPDYEGPELIKEIKRFTEVPVIVITGQGDEILAATMIKLGAKDYIPKNKIEGLADAVRNAVKVSEQESYKTKSLASLAKMGEAIDRRIDDSFRAGVVTPLPE